MGKYLLNFLSVIAFVLVSFGSSVGQFSYDPSPVVISVAPSFPDLKTEVFINNNQDSTYRVYWRIVKDANTWQAGWSTYLCDLNLCYLPNVDQCSPNLPNIMGQGTHKFEFHFVPNNIAGNTSLFIKLYSDNTFTNEILSIPVTIASVSSTSGTYVDNIRITPNPATNYFSLYGAVGVKKMYIYNILGKEIKVIQNVNSGASYDISDLKKGMYIIKLFDEKNRSVKTLKLHKVLDGV